MALPSAHPVSVPRRLLLIDGTERIMQRKTALKPTNLCAKAVSPQHIAHFAVRSDDAQGNAVTGKFAMQFVQHRAGREIDLRRCREIEDDQANSRRVLSLKTI